MVKTILAGILILSTHHVYAESTHHENQSSVTADQGQKYLENGNKRFVTGKFRGDGKKQTDVTRLEGGQKPHSIILSCSDSRVPPELIFDQALGEVFVIRVAGEALDNSVIASMEYAVEHLGAKNIVVMGHTQCGAVKAAIGTAKGSSAGSPSLDALVSDIKPRLPASVPSKDFSTEANANTKGIADDLLKRSEIIKAKVESGDVKIRKGLYNLHDGKVSWQ